MSGSKEELLELLKNHIDESNKKHDRTYSKLEQQDSTLSTILIQAQKTNGRVLSLEGSREEMKNSLKDQDQVIKSHSRTIWGVSAVISAFMFIGGFFYKLKEYVEISSKSSAFFVSIRNVGTFFFLWNACFTSNVFYFNSCQWWLGLD